MAGSTVLRKYANWYTRLCGDTVPLNPETVMDWKSEELPKIIDGYQPKDVLNVDEIGLFCNLQSSKDIRRWILPWWSIIKAEGHCFAGLQC
jgi:hypothetical protein